MEITKVGVLGCGTMGSGICEVVARAGLQVSFVEVTPEAVEAGHARVAASLQRAVDRGRLQPEEMDHALGRIHGDTSYDDLADAHLIVEAVPERLEDKREAMRRVGEVASPDAILATNTSSLPVIDIAVATGQPDRFLGFHFFNPAPVMELIELITTVVTAPEVVEHAKAFAARLDKTPVVAGDRAGFVANLLLFPYLNQAVGMVEDGYASREDIDAAMRLGAGHPMGPLALMDLIGLDSANAILERMYEQFADVRYAPRPLLRQLLTAGYRGRKSGRGFYRYGTDDGGARSHRDAEVPSVSVDDWARVGVVGTGTMATGIAEVAAANGYEVVLRGRTREKAEAAHAAVRRSLDKQVDRGRLERERADQIVARIEPVADLQRLDRCDVVVEAVAEDLDVKRELFAELGSVTKPDALLATTTSSLPVIECAMASGRPERVVGAHFFNPATRMRLVEVVDTVRCEPEALAQAEAWARRLDKHPVRCADRSGLIVNALLFPYLNDAVKMLEEGYAKATDIDTAMKLGCGHPMGPFELMDVVGLDVTFHIMRALHAEFREPGFAPAPLLQHMVTAGYLGRKSGRGFHTY